MAEFCSMPAEVRALRHPWPSLAGTLPGLTVDLENRFRFGQRVDNTPRGYFIGGTLKGGSSSMWEPTSEEPAVAYTEWKRHEGFGARASSGSLDRLREFLQPLDVEPELGDASKDSAEYWKDLSDVFDLAVDILEKLPPLHLSRSSLTAIRFGGWGQDSAKASSYNRGRVSLYEFAVRGARRTFIGLILHELGHAHAASWTPRQKARLAAEYRALVERNSFLGVEFLLDAESRRAYQRMNLSEFLAETYMIYCSCGATLRRFVAEQAGALHGSWERIYAMYRKSFGGVEYD